MKEGELEFVDDKLFVIASLPQYDNMVCQKELVMTKEIFQECYRRWIEQKESED